jgi:dihydrofolate reductase
LTNIVYIATSLDGFISAPNGNLEWLETVPNPTEDDLGFSKFMDRVDAIVMGRVTFETVVGFEMGWHYPIPGIVLSSSMTSAPEGFAEHVKFASGSPKCIVQIAQEQGHENLYIDGGKTIQRFLDEDVIDELIVTEIPILLGGGDRLFGKLDQQLTFELLGTEVLLGQLVKKHYRRKRS